MVFDFASANSPCQEKPPYSFLNFTVDLPVTSGEPGPMAPSANLVSHFQLPSKPFMKLSSSLEGAGIGGAAGAAGAAAPPLAAGVGAADGAAAAGLAAGAA